jgi:hypothetical protein
MQDRVHQPYRKHLVLPRKLGVDVDPGATGYFGVGYTEFASWVTRDLSFWRGTNDISSRNTQFRKNRRGNRE